MADAVYSLDMRDTRRRSMSSTGRPPSRRETIMSLVELLLKQDVDETSST